MLEQDLGCLTEWRETLKLQLWYSKRRFGAELEVEEERPSQEILQFEASLDVLQAGFAYKQSVFSYDALKGKTGLQEINISLPWPLSDRSESSLDVPQALVISITEKLLKPGRD